MVDLVERAAEVMRQHIKCDATGLSPAVASAYITGIEAAAQALSDAGMLAEGWRPIETAPKDRTPVLALIHSRLYPDIAGESRRDLERWNGLQVVIHHPGLAEDGFDIGWSVSAPVGTGIGRDDWFVGWRRLDPPVLNCQCTTCEEERARLEGWGPMDPRLMRMFLCEICGNKRCPHANDHRHACTGSNEPGQRGSSYP